MKYITPNLHYSIGLLLVLGVGMSFAGEDSGTMKCANLIYAGSKSSVCFSSKFLKSVRNDTNLNTDEDFTPVRLDSDTLFEYPFAVMTGEGSFTLREPERKNLREYLDRGGFLLASAGCSSSEWGRSFHRELKQVYPDVELGPIPMEHPMFDTVFRISSIKLKNGGTTYLQGLELNGRTVLVYTSEGLNDTSSVKGCCCCGGNEIRNSHDINVNILTYSVLH